MINLFIFGIEGRMGSLTKELAAQTRGVNLVGGFSTRRGEGIFNSVKEIDVPVDVIIDFSSPDATDELIELTLKKRCALVVASTGHSTQQTEAINQLSSVVPLLVSPNLSEGVNGFLELVAKATELFPDADIEIIDYHHSKKLDSPSGTAKAISRRITQKRRELYPLLRTTFRSEGEIGMSSVRCGTVVGRHDVIFASKNETVTLTHNAEGREIFAQGGINVAMWLAKKPKGRYTMEEFLKERRSQN